MHCCIKKIMTSILVFSFDKVIRLTLEDIIAQLSWTTADILLWCLRPFLKPECSIDDNYMEKNNQHTIQNFSFLVSNQ